MMMQPKMSIHIIDGKNDGRYSMFDRNARVGEKVVITNAKPIEIRTVSDVFGYTITALKDNGIKTEVFHSDYFVIVPKSYQETVTIPKEEYDKLVENTTWLECLEGAGVDNWDGYGEAQDMLKEVSNE